MKINFSQVLLSLSGEPFKKDKDTDATLGDMCVTALLAEDPSKPMVATEKIARWELGKQLYKGGEVELTADDMVLIKDSVAVAFIPALMGSIYDALEELSI